MKLYTEEQILEFLENKIIFDSDDLNELNSIELPSDEEIGKYARQSGLVHPFVERGAKWMRDKIGGNK